MKCRFFHLICGLCFLLGSFSASASADASHARIVRLSLVQGDVRFASTFKDDPLSDAKADWQAAPLNLPIRQGFVLATDNGRAEVEFESGAMLFLGPGTVVEFYDLSLQEGARITRLVLRQGTAISYVNPANGDYFSLTGGDFTVEATTRARFRLDNFDDGSTVSVEQGRVSIVRDKQSTPLSKDQSLSIHTNDADKQVIGRAADPDDFDHWVSGRIDSVATATNYSNQYVSSPGYTAGFGDLYTYGSWFPMGGYGYCWRPFGVGLGWSPFDYGLWYNDASIGYTFIGYAPWGWLPYHYGGWIFSPAYGWAWAPVGFGGYSGPSRYYPVTAVWVHNGGTLGVVPLHPGDKPGKTAQNLSQGIYTVENLQVTRNTVATDPKNWSVISHAPPAVLSSSLTSSSAPPRVSRTVLAGTTAGNRAVNFGRASSIMYDPVEHRYVNSGNLSAEQEKELHEASVQQTDGTHTAENGTVAHGPGPVQRPAKPGAPVAPSSARINAPPAPPRSPAIPAPARTGGGSPGTASWGGRSPSGAYPSFGGSGSGSGSHPSGGGSGGGARPH